MTPDAIAPTTAKGERLAIAAKFSGVGAVTCGASVRVSTIGTRLMPSRMAAMAKSSKPAGSYVESRNWPLPKAP